mmetsp:Transcript_20223/g.40822  ORF Transcript_20223/g.40822 Transcript_20223/m.40822 type:complete len:145 (-) Transcript_20223:276-710(-)
MFWLPKRNFRSLSSPPPSPLSPSLSLFSSLCFFSCFLKINNFGIWEFGCPPSLLEDLIFEKRTKKAMFLPQKKKQKKCDFPRKHVLEFSALHFANKQTNKPTHTQTTQECKGTNNTAKIDTTRPQTQVHPRKNKKRRKKEATNN